MARTRAIKTPLFTIGRSIDLRVPTNRAIVVTFAAGWVGWLTAHLALGDPPLQALRGATIFAAAIFLAWALGREIDPDRWFSAFLSAGATAAAGLLLGEASLGILLWGILGVRLIHRSPGGSPGVLDLVLFTGVTVWLGISIHWTLPLLALPVIPLASVKHQLVAARYAAAAALTACGGTLAFIGGAEGGWIVWRTWQVPVIVAITIALIPAVRSYRTVRSVGDRTGEPLNPRRVQAAIGWTAAVALVVTVAGPAGFARLAPVWAALAGTALGWAIERVRGGFAR